MKQILLIAASILFLASNAIAQNALNFDGSNDFVQTNFGGVTGSADRTFEAWVYVPSSAPASNLCILDYGANAVGSRNTFAVSGSRKLTFTSGGTNANMGSTLVDAVPEDQWVHVAFVLSSGTGYVYVNGVEEGTGVLTTVNTPTTGTNVRVGQRVPGGSILFNGAIDEVRVWSVAKTPAEILANMNSELCGVQPNLELYLKMNEGTAGATNSGITSAGDNSVNGNNGTLTNFALTGATSNWVAGSGISSLSTSGSTVQSACGSYSLQPGSTVYTSTGIYTETLYGANFVGCDSIVTLDLTINNSTLGTDVQSACDTYTWIDGNTYASSNTTATYILMNSVGCDSIVVLNLTINNNTGTDVQTACDSYTWIDGNTYTSDNNSATVTLTNSAGCDSLVTLNLTVGNTSTTTTDTQSACSSYTWIDGNVYTSNNNSAMVTLTNASGCDSIIVLDLTITNIDPAVTQSGAGVVLTSDDTGATYQWVICPNFTPIVGETNQTFTATTNGDYAVILTNGQCSDTSACSSVTTVGVFENELNNMTVYPNPTNGEFSINLGEELNSVTILITDLTGKVIHSSTYENSKFVNIDLDEPTGIYLLSIESENKRGILRLVKK